MDTYTKTPSGMNIYSKKTRPTISPGVADIFAGRKRIIVGDDEPAYRVPHKPEPLVVPAKGPALVKQKKGKPVQYTVVKRETVVAKKQREKKAGAERDKVMMKMLGR